MTSFRLSRSCLSTVISGYGRRRPAAMFSLLKSCDAYEANRICLMSTASASLFRNALNTSLTCMQCIQGMNSRC